MHTKAGYVSLPPVSLAGRESKVLSTDLAVGKSTHLQYTTASILYYLLISCASPWG